MDCSQRLAFGCRVMSQGVQVVIVWRRSPKPWRRRRQRWHRRRRERIRPKGRQRLLRRPKGKGREGGAGRLHGEGHTPERLCHCRPRSILLLWLWLWLWLLLLLAAALVLRSAEHEVRGSGAAGLWLLLCSVWLLWEHAHLGEAGHHAIRRHLQGHVSR